MLVNDLPFERNKNNLKTKNFFFPIFRVDHVRLSNEYFFASCDLEQEYTYVQFVLRNPTGPEATTLSLKMRTLAMLDKNATNS